MRSLGIGTPARDEHGQSLVEVALMLPLLLLIVLGFVDVGRTYASKSATTNAARDAAVYAARGTQVSGVSICQRAADELGGAGCWFDSATDSWRATTTPLAPLSVRWNIAVTCARNIPAGPIRCDAATDPLDQEAAAADVQVRVFYEVSLLSTYFLQRIAGGGRATVGAAALVPAAGR